MTVKVLREFRDYSLRRSYKPGDTFDCPEKYVLALKNAGLVEETAENTAKIVSKGRKKKVEDSSAK